MFNSLKLSFVFLVCLFFIGCQNSSKKNVQNQIEKENLEDTSNQDIKKVQLVSSDGVYKLYVKRKDSSVTWPGFCCGAYRVFGYESPSLKSKKVILISVFSKDIKGNPLRLKFGAYHQIFESDSITLKLINIEGAFAKIAFKNHKNYKGTVYFEKKWVQFEEEE